MDEEDEQYNNKIIWVYDFVILGKIVKVDIKNLLKFVVNFVNN